MEEKEEKIDINDKKEEIKINNEEFKLLLKEDWSERKEKIKIEGISGDIDVYQIIDCINISIPKYRIVKLEDEDEEQEEEEVVKISRKSGRIPRTPRMLKLLLYDGTKTQIAYEYEPIGALDSFYDIICNKMSRCCAKIALYNKPVVKRNTLWITNSNVKILFEGYSCNFYELEQEDEDEEDYIIIDSDNEENIQLETGRVEIDISPEILELADKCFDKGYLDDEEIMEDEYGVNSMSDEDNFGDIDMGSIPSEEDIEIISSESYYTEHLINENIQEDEIVPITLTIESNRIEESESEKEESIINEDIVNETKNEIISVSSGDETSSTSKDSDDGTSSNSSSDNSSSGDVSSEKEQKNEDTWKLVVRNEDSIEGMGEQFIKFLSNYQYKDVVNSEIIPDMRDYFHRKCNYLDHSYLCYIKKNNMENNNESFVKYCKTRFEEPIKKYGEVNMENFCKLLNFSRKLESTVWEFKGEYRDYRYGFLNHTSKLMVDENNEVSVLLRKILERMDIEDHENMWIGIIDDCLNCHFCIFSTETFPEIEKKEEELSMSLELNDITGFFLTEDVIMEEVKDEINMVKILRAHVKQLPANETDERGRVVEGEFIKILDDYSL